MSTNYSPTIVTDGAVFVGDALMPSTATSATTLYDRVGGNNGTMYNGSCADFDGTDDYIDCGTPSSMDSLSAFSISLWFKLDSLAADCNLISKGVYSTDYAFAVQARPSQSGANKTYHARITTDGSQGTSTIINSAVTTWTTSDWYHLVFVYTGSEAGYYANGAALGAFTAHSGAAGPGATSETLKIGRLEGNTSKDMNGKIADVRIYNVALSLSQAAEIYNDSKVIIPSNVSQTNLIGWWPLADGAGSLAYDGSGNGHTGTLQDNAQWLTGQTGGPQLVEGYNRAMLFDGGNDAAVKDVADYRSGDSSGTMAAWVNFNALDDYQVVFGSFDFASGDKYIEIFLRNDGKIAFARDDGSDTADYFYYNTALTVNTWYHVAVTSDGSSYTFYVNGAEVTKTFGGGSDTGDWFADTSDRDNICIGVLKYNSTHDNWLDGLATEVVVYDTPLSAGQISTLATTDANGGPLPPLTLPAASNVVGHWRYDNDVTWTDLSSGGNDLTVQGSPSSLLFKQGINGSKNVNTGRDNQGFPLKFKNVGALGMKLGVDDAVNFGSAPAFAQIANPGGATIGTWIRVDSASDLNGLMGPWIGTGNAGWGIFTNYSGGINMIVDDGADGSGYWVGQNTPKVVVPADGSFHYVLLTVVRNGVGSNASVSHYLDGVLYNTITFTNENGAAAWGSGGSTVFRLGNMSGGTNYFNGQIANMHMYNRVLSYAEIQQNYKAQRSRFE